MSGNNPYNLTKPDALPVVTADLTGKTVLVTGANSGVGFEASKHFAKMNPDRLILTSRDAAKGAEALKSTCLSSQIPQSTSDMGYVAQSFKKTRATARAKYGFSISRILQVCLRSPRRLKSSSRLWTFSS